MSEKDERGNDDERGEEESPSPPQTPPTLSYATPPGPVKFKTLRRLSSFEANLAAAKLEAAGVRCFVADEYIVVANPLVFPNVRLQVAEDDIELAEQALATATTPPDRAEERDRDADDEYVEEAYRCPRCHRKQVDLLPLSPAMRNTRLGCLALLVIPIVISVAGWLSDVPPGFVAAWVVAVAVLSYLVITAKRGKRCRECGHEWTKGETSGDS